MHPAPSPERSACRQQVQRELRKAPAWQEASLSGLGALALRRADSHWLRSFTFCREWGEVADRSDAGLQGHPPPPILAVPHLALQVGGVQRPRAVLRHHLHHVRQLEGAFLHPLYRADVGHRDGGARLGERVVKAGWAEGCGWGVGPQGQLSSACVHHVVSPGVRTFNLLYL